MRQFINSHGVIKPLIDQLKVLTDLNDVAMTLGQRREFMTKILNNLAAAVTQRVPVNQMVLPADESEVWEKAGRIALAHFGLQGETAFLKASQWLAAELEEGSNVQA
ncbi:hypothetical protein [Erwinia tasmaniensis]|uniref:Uncharacterized protein n=1 Tax=Erwinia tasmaniensis (strain DSM 17950 / CFBP 7177 / CIP 109463 / NCPPB 4357 / Et1/99) TaxID=465817 RepID=B2VB74_ERWT9|nr:hypothetical protein [Erwinia tasmaniensis]CAO95037.1 Hypothetical protein ETA_pET460470 [Erwinia tasmaniensis Et1/99]